MIHQTKLTPDARRALARAYARMLEKVRDMAEGKPSPRWWTARDAACAAFWAAVEAGRGDPMHAGLDACRDTLKHTHQDSLL